MIPLASDLLPFPGQIRREGLLESASSPNQLSSSGRAWILGTLSWKCPEVIAALWIKTLHVANVLQRAATRWCVAYRVSYSHQKAATSSQAMVPWRQAQPVWAI